VLGSAVLCYAALGLVLRALPGYVAHTLHSVFAYFDAGVGLGGPAVGATAGAIDAGAALALAGAAVFLAVPAALLRVGGRSAARCPSGSGARLLK